MLEADRTRFEADLRELESLLRESERVSIRPTPARVWSSCVLFLALPQKRQARAIGTLTAHTSSSLLWQHAADSPAFQTRSLMHARSL